MKLFLQYSCVWFLLLWQYTITQAQQDSYANQTTRQGQSVRGTVVDQASNTPLIYATVELLNHSPIISTVTDENGRFELQNVPIGHQRIRVDRHEYYAHIETVLVGAGKEVILTVELEEEYTTERTEPADDLTQKDRRRMRNSKMDPVNDMTSVSYRAVEFEEVNRYPGSLEDPARAASNFTGAYNIDDPQNYMIIRGNSPFGVRWQIDGIPVDNPHHLARLGNTGAIFPILNTNVLDRADFLTGAFSAEYSNAFSGIFDISTRKGNNQKLEFAGEISLWGAEIMLEGPIKKGGASFILSYRYSVVQFAQAFGINTSSNSSPTYQDLNLKIDIPTKVAGDFSLFALGGISNVSFLANEYQASDIFALKSVNVKTATQMSLVGLSNKKFIGEKHYLKTTASYLFENYESDKDSLSEGTFYVFTDTTTGIRDSIRTSAQNVLIDYYQARSMRNRIGLSSTLNTKWNPRLTTRAGIYGYVFFLNIDEQDLLANKQVYFSDDLLIHTGGFMQAKFKISPRFIMNLGVHGQYFTLNNNSWSVEPRLSFNWFPGSRHKVSFGYSWNSRLEPFSISFHVQEENTSNTYNNSNRELGLLNSQQVVLSYNLLFAEQWSLNVNAYGQYHTNIPIDQLPSSFSLINYGVYETPRRVNLVDDGVAVNAGGEVSVEKFLSQGYYGILSGSYFRSLYQASDQVWRNTSFDIQYMAKLVVGKEFKIGPKKRNAFTADLRVMHRGGTPYTPILLAESQAAGTAVYDETATNSLRLDPYTRIDVKIGARINSKKVSHYFFIDLINVANLSNPRQHYYDSATQTIEISKQFGFIPNVFYRIQF
ncbi:MAG: TonB-dependent receptor [Aureispira sp.]